MRAESSDLYYWVALTKVKAGKVESDILRVIDQRNVAWQRLSKLAERVGALGVERDAAHHDASSLEALLKCARREALG